MADTIITPSGAITSGDVTHSTGRKRRMGIKAYSKVTDESRQKKIIKLKAILDNPNGKSPAAVQNIQNELDYFESMSPGDNYLPYYSGSTAQEDIHHKGIKLPKEYGHRGVAFSRHEPGYKELDKEAADLGYMPGVSTLGVDWSKPSKQDRFKGLLHDLNLGIERGMQTLVTANNAYQPKVSDTSQEFIAPELRIEQDIPFEKVDDELLGYIADKPNIEDLRSGLGLNPGDVQATLDQLKGMPKDNRMARTDVLHRAIQNAQKRRVAEQLVNARPTRVYSMGGHVKPNDIVDVPSEVVNTEVGEPKVNNQQRDAAFSEAIRKLEPKKRLQAIVEGYLTDKISTGTMSWELFEMFPFNDRERSQFENKLRRQYGVLHPSLHDFEEDNSTVSNIKDALR